MNRILVFAKNIYSILTSFGNSFQIVDSHLEIPYISALPGDCGLGCVVMVNEYKNKKRISVISLTKTYKNHPYYLSNIGWNHSGLVIILSKFNIKARQIEYQNIKNINMQLLQKKPIIVSLHVPAISNLSQSKIYQPIDTTIPNVGHLCLVVGISTNNIILHDPRNSGIYHENLRVPFSTFKKIFTGRCIYIE